LPILTHPDRRKAYIAELGGRKPIRVERAPEDATWGNALLDFGLYGIVAAVSQFVMWHFAVDILERISDGALKVSVDNAPNLDAISNMSMTSVLLISVLVGVGAVVAMVLQGVFTHLAAAFMLGGTGTLPYLYRKLVPLQTVVVLIGAAAVVALGLWGGAFATLVFLAFGGMVGNLAVYYLTVRAVAKVYDFDYMSSVGALSLGSGLFVAVLFGCVYGAVRLFA